MPISLICGACEAKLTAPDAAAGKKVKCRQCGVVLEVPLPEPEPEDHKARPKPAAALPPPKPKPRPVLLEASEDEDEDRAPTKTPPTKLKTAVILSVEYEDDDEEEEQPKARKKKKGKAKKKKAAANPMPLILGGGGVALLLVIGLIWYFASGSNSETTAQNSTTGAGPSSQIANTPGSHRQPSAPKPATGNWVNYSDPKFDVWAPRGVQAVKKSSPTSSGTAESVTWTTSTKMSFLVNITILPANLVQQVEADRDLGYQSLLMQMAGHLPTGMILSPAVKVTNDGVEGRQVDGTVIKIEATVGMRARLIVSDGKLYLLTCVPVNFTKGEDRNIDEFFDNFIPK